MPPRVGVSSTLDNAYEELRPMSGMEKDLNKWWDCADGSDKGFGVSKSCIIILQHGIFT